MCIIFWGNSSNPESIATHPIAAVICGELCIRNVEGVSLRSWLIVVTCEMPCSTQRNVSKNSAGIYLIACFFVTPSRVQRIWSKGKAGCPATSRSNEHPMKKGNNHQDPDQSEGTNHMTTISVYGLVSICFSDGGRAHVLAQAK